MPFCITNPVNHLSCCFFSNLKICPVYYDVENVNGPITITILLTNANTPRMWEIKVTYLEIEPTQNITVNFDSIFGIFARQISQIEFNRRAPAGCTQYFPEPSGKFEEIIDSSLL